MSNPYFALVRNIRSLQHFDEEEYRQVVLYAEVLRFIETCGFPVTQSMLTSWQARSVTYMNKHQDLAAAVVAAFKKEHARRCATG